MSYYQPLQITARLTGKKESYASYLDRSNKVFSEHTLTQEDKRKGNIGYKFFTNQKKLTNYLQKTQAIITKVDRLKKEIDRLDVSRLTANQIWKFVKKAEPIYAQSMGYYLILQSEYTAKLSQVILKELAKYIPASKLQEEFLTLIKAVEPTCLEVERRTWLENIVIPFKEGQINNQEKNTLINKQVRLFKYLSASSQFGLWDEKYYKKLFYDESLKSLKSLKKELEIIKDKGRQTEISQKEIIAGYKLPDSLFKKIETVRTLSWLRLEAHLKGWAFFHYIGPLLVARAATILKVPKEDVFNLTLEEFYKLLAGKLILTKEHRQRCGGNILTIITPQKGCEVFWAKEAEKKYNSELAEVIKSRSEFSGQLASGIGKVRGRVFVFRWGEKNIDKKIYLFPAGRILVAGQTMPQFMPAIRKAKAIITNEGGMLCHAAIVSRELKIPAIIGTKIATEILKDGDLVEMDLSKGKIKILKAAGRA
jgi:phosphohistidine swiveling domain-containing protein